MEKSVFLLFLKCIDGIGDSALRKMILNGSFKNMDLKTSEDIIKFLKKNSQFLSKKFLSANITIDLLKKAKEKRLKITRKLKEMNAGYITWFDDNYPKRYKNMQYTNDFPVILFYKGDISLMNFDKTCSIIGTREPTLETQEIGTKIVYKMVENNYVVISGLALGCDSIGHVSCLDAGGRTVAIMGTGLDTIYPKENKELADRIINNGGLLLTEELPGFKGAAYSFVNRDRLQAAGADIVIVLETAVDGGTMHASKAATQKYHRTLAVLSPELIPSGKTSGNIELINFFGGKKLQDVLDIDNYI